MTPPPTLEVVDVRKTFGSLRALDGVSLSLQPGTVHALLGENGAGKSTLVKCMMGYHRPDAGRVLVGGRQVVLRSPRDAQELGIGMVYQHFTVVENMTVAENLLLARSRLPFRIDWRAERAALERFMARMPFALDLAAPVRTLAAGEKQKLEILKQLHVGSRIVILDEPTSVLTPGEADEVLGLLRDMARAGELSVLMITHKFREVQVHADEVTVLRRGRMAGRGLVAELTPARMAEMMVGAASEATALSRAGEPPGSSLLTVDSLEADDDRGAPALRGISFEVRAGEVLGIAGVAGNGQEQLVQVLAGQRRARGGRVSVHGRQYRATRAEIAAHRVRCLPEEPLRNACVAAMSVSDNMAFRDFDRPPFTVARWGLRRRGLRERARRLIGEYQIRTPSADAPIGHLSGGNVQRAVLARELGDDVQVLIAANPCMGLDFAAVAEIHARIVRARNRGSAVLLVSQDLDEVFALSDRIAVMSGGRLTHETPIGAADLATIGRHMAGHA